jgi:hypothetical protein
MKVRARLLGTALVALGFGGMALVYLFWSHGAGLMLRPPLPPGMREDLVPVFSPFVCILPLAAVASVLLVVEGLRRIIGPE